MGTSFHTEMWNVFTFYTLAANPDQPDLLRCDQFMKFVLDCKVLGKLKKPDVAIIVRHVISRQKQNTTSNTMLNYHGFLTATMRVAERVYDKDQPEVAFEKFLMEHVVAHAKRRSPRVEPSLMNDLETAKLLHKFEQPLYSIFRFYASAQERKENTLVVEHKSMSSGSHGEGNTMVNELGHEDFLWFCKDYGLSNSCTLTTTCLGAVYLDSLDNSAFHKKMPKLTFPEFLEAIVRIAQVLGDSVPSESPPCHKLKLVFLMMWRAAHVQGKFKAKVECHAPKNRDASDLLRGTMAFNSKFSDLWAQDGHRNYLSPEKREPTDPFDIISQICHKTVQFQA